MFGFTFNGIEVCRNLLSCDLKGSVPSMFFTRSKGWGAGCGEIRVGENFCSRGNTGETCADTSADCYLAL
jgi:hypothetical protein